MFLKRLGILAVLWGLLVFPLSAHMVSFLVIETGLLPDTEVDEYSTLWEDGLMRGFFDTGHIVTNSPVLRLEKTPLGEIPAEAQADFAEASEGGADYFVLALLDYFTQDGKSKPRQITVRVFATASRKMIYEHKFPAGNGTDLKDEYARAQDASRIVAAQVRQP